MVLRLEGLLRAKFSVYSMHMLPKSQNSGFYKHAANSKFHIDYTMVDTPNPEDVSLCITRILKLVLIIESGRLEVVLDQTKFCFV